MAELATLLPPRRPELVIRPLGEKGQYVVKDPGSGAYFHLGPEEHFLLEQLDGQKDAVAICTAYEQKFGQALTGEDLDGFIELARGQGFLLDDAGRGQDAETRGHGDTATETPGQQSVSPRPRVAVSPRPKQSILYWRKNLFDPDRIFTWLAPKIWFFWTPAFLIFSAVSIVIAIAIAWANGGQLVSGFIDALSWQTALLAWLMIFVVTMLHESAHGLTCKHHGGEVHEIGFLLMFFMPCFYCNVSDAWLFKEKSKRLWVTFAGGYFELFLWAVAVFVWRLTLPNSLLNYLALIVVTLCGVQTLFNFIPLIKLDGYYLLSDWLEIPNLQQRSTDHTKARLRRLLWGAPPAQGEERGRLMTTFGSAAILFSAYCLLFSLVALGAYLGHLWGIVGLGLTLLLGIWVARSFFRGSSAGEIRKMILARHKRTVIWGLVLAGVVVVMCIPIEDRVRGPFQVRCVTRAEVRAPVSGFLREIYFDEGDRLTPGALVAKLEIPDLLSRLAQKRAEISEAQAKLQMLKQGARPEELAEQRRRVQRAEGWRDLAQRDLQRAENVFKEDLNRLDLQIVRCRTELETYTDIAQRAKGLLAHKSIAEETYREAEGKRRVAQAQLAQAEAERRACAAKGTVEAEAELARREKELADARAVLTLLEAGTRPEELDAERARLSRLQEEARYLEKLEGQLRVIVPVSGLLATPRFKEKVGQFVREGDLLCNVEEPSELEVEIQLSEQDAARVDRGLAVEIKARALPFETLAGQVHRLAPVACKGDSTQNALTIYCRMDETHPELRPGMSGQARIYTGRRMIGQILLERTLRLVRTEFWW